MLITGICFIWSYICFVASAFIKVAGGRWDIAVIVSAVNLVAGLTIKKIGEAYWLD